MSPRRIRFDIRQASRPILLVFGVWLVLALAFYGALVRPRIRTYRVLMEENEPRLTALRQREGVVKRQEEYLAALHRAEKDLKTLRYDVLSTRDRRMIKIQLELAHLAREFQINLEQVQYQNTRLEEEQLERFAMVVPLEGGYANLRKFLQAVENSDKFLVIERVALAQGKEGGVLLQLNITLATYFDDPEARRKAEQEKIQRGRKKKRSRRSA